MKTTQARRDELRQIAKILQGKPNWKCVTGEEAIDLLDDVDELRGLLRRASGELHVVGSYRDNAETAGLYITAKAQHDLAVEIDAALAEEENS